MEDRSSRPHRPAGQTPRRRERRIIGLRVSRRWGPARIAYHLGMHPSTVHRVLTRYHCVKLSWTDPATGAPLRATRRHIVRYEHAAPGDLVHVDIKKLGRIPDGGGHRVHGRAIGGHNRRAHSSSPKTGHGVGYAYIHHAVDDHSRYVYSEILTDERKGTASAFMTRAIEHFTTLGVTIKRVLTDNGSCHRSRQFGSFLADHGIAHKKTRPCRPQTNGKVERFNRTAVEEWAYARPRASEHERIEAYPAFLHTYNHERGHTALNGASPASRITNLPGQNT